MIAKALEIRDKATFIPALAVDMNPQASSGLTGFAAQRYLLRRCGYSCDDKPNILVTRLAGDGTPATNDPYFWGGRTWPVAHQYIIEHWHDLQDGDVVDVEFILGETAVKKSSERYEEVGQI